MMPIATIVTGLLLSAVGLWGYFGAEEKSPTPLIPLGFGALLIVLGGLSFVASARKHAMHFVAALALIGVVLPLIRIGMVLAQGKEPGGRGFQALVAMTVLSAVLLGLCINSFIQARRARKIGA